jgi:predicted PurR-regulated permease PerM
MSRLILPTEPEGDPASAVLKAAETTSAPAPPPAHLARPPMALWQKSLAWLGVLIAACLLLWLLSGVLLPFLVGAAVAYFLDPAVRRLTLWGVPRTLAAILMIALLFGSLVAGLSYLIPMVLAEAASLSREVPTLLTDLRDFMSRELGEDPDDEDGQFQQFLAEAGASLRENAQTLLAGVFYGVSGLMRLVLFWVVMPVVAFYLLADWPRFLRSMDSLLPREHALTIRGLAREIDETIAGFVRGEVIVCSILAGYYVVALMAVGLSYGLVIGLVAGFVSFVPYVGAFIGGALAIGFGLYQFWGEPWWIGAVVAIFLFGQFLESNVLVPSLVGSSVNLHPVWLIFAVLAFGTLFGLVGALIAVPVAAAMGVLVRFGLGRYRESGLYRGRMVRIETE